MEKQVGKVLDTDSITKIAEIVAKNSDDGIIKPHIALKLIAMGIVPGYAEELIAKMKENFQFTEAQTPNTIS